MEQQIASDLQNFGKHCDKINNENKQLNNLVDDQAEDFKKKEANLESTIRYLYICL